MVVAVTQFMCTLWMFPLFQTCGVLWRDKKFLFISKPPHPLVIWYQKPFSWAWRTVSWIPKISSFSACGFLTKFYSPHPAGLLDRIWLIFVTVHLLARSYTQWSPSFVDKMRGWNTKRCFVPSVAWATFTEGSKRPRNLQLRKHPHQKVMYLHWESRFHRTLWDCFQENHGIEEICLASSLWLLHIK